MSRLVPYAGDTLPHKALLHICARKGSTEIDILFLYLIYAPFVKSHYELAILNNKKEIISSEIIKSDNYFIEKELPDLPAENKYAVVLYTYNSFKEKDDLIIRMIE